MILIDTPDKNDWSHMVSDDINELHEFSYKLGIKQCWFQNKRGKNQPHYDVKRKYFNKAKELEAIQVTRKQLFEFLKKHYK